MTGGSGPNGPDADPPEERTGYRHWKGTSGEAEEESTDTSGAPDAAAGGEPGAAGTCELCGGPTLERHCKILCLRCGYQRDCSDP